MLVIRRRTFSQRHMLSSGVQKAEIGVVTITNMARAKHGADRVPSNPAWSISTCQVELVDIAIAASVRSKFVQSCQSRTTENPGISTTVVNMPQPDLAELLSTHPGSYPSSRWVSQRELRLITTA